MIPDGGDHLSLLMGAPRIADEELRALGAEIVGGAGPGVRRLLVPERSLVAYRDLVRAKLDPGFWNETAGRDGIFFVFKGRDGGLEELAYSPETRERIARLCAQWNGEALEKTSDIPRYLARSDFYRDLMVASYDVEPS